jgi:TorA maturation chaperone TorD
VEFEFVATLLDQEVKCWSNNDPSGVKLARQSRRTFLSDHLSQWLPTFRSEVAERAEYGFYPELCRFA